MRLRFATAENVFSRTEFDFGSQLLLQSFLALHSSEKTAISRESTNAGPAARSSWRVCDLGCGWGPVGAFLKALRSDFEVSGVDLNPRAAQLAHFNLRQNNLDAAIWCGDGLDAVPARFFNAVLCNPPVRAGNRAIDKLFDDAQRTLQTGGELWVVIRTAQGAKSWQKRLASQFGACETIEIERGFRVLRCIESSHSN